VPRVRFPTRRIVIVVMIVACMLIAAVGGPWLSAWWSGVSGSARRSASIGVLLGLLVAYGAALALALIAGATATARLVSARRMGARRPISARIALLSASILLSLGMLEASAWGLAAWNRFPPPSPSVEVPKSIKAKPRDRPSNELVLLVLGESSAEGQPFQPWFSIGHAGAWQIERANPGTRVRVVMDATGGVGLSYVVGRLGTRETRPDIVVLCSGHNEFQSRWPWSRVVNYYNDDASERPRDGLSDRVGDWTPLCRLIRDAVDHQRIGMAPVLVSRRMVFDRPVCEPDVRAELARRFATDLETVATWCVNVGAVPIFVIPAGNDVGFDPSRSLLAPETGPAERNAFAADFLAARALAATDPEAAMAAYARLIERQPGFAESHYRLAQHLQARGLLDDARRHFAQARDLDGLPLRCPTEFQDAYRAVADTHPIVLVDSPSVLRTLSPSGMLDDNVFHDGQHPTFRAYLALAQNALDQLRGRKLFGLDRANLPPLDPSEVSAHFGMNAAKWAVVCERSRNFWWFLSPSRYDDTDRKDRAARFDKAAAKIRAGTPPEQAGIPGLGVRPEGFP